MTESCEKDIYTQVVRPSKSNNIGYINFVRHVTPTIIDDLHERGWFEHARNKVLVRYIANAKWQSLTDDERNCCR